MITVDGVRMASTEIHKAEQLVPEIEEGNREYKFKLTDLSDDQLTHRITQLNWRLNEGNDEAFYLIGVEDNGNPLGLSDADLQESLKNLQFIADQVGCEMMVRQLYAGEQGTTAEVHMRRRERTTVEVVQVNVAVAGDLDSGKSTMIGVLCTGQLDNGKGLARTKVLTHNHEVETGLTSCISHHSLHFSGDGEILNADPLPGTGRSKRIRALSDFELADETNRTVVLMDLAGHAKYLKTTLHGLIGRRPDHCIVCVSATTGLNSITTEHIGVCMYLNVPLVIVITKADCVGHSARPSSTRSKPKCKIRTNSYGETPSAAVGVADSAAADGSTASSPAIGRLMESIQQVLASLQRTAMVVSDEDQLVQLLQRSAEADRAAGKELVPVFTVSNVTGDGLQLLKSYLFQLPTHAKSRLDLQQQSTCIRILGSIGNTDEREEVVYPRDEDLYSVKKEVRHSTNRCATTARETGNMETIGIAQRESPPTSAVKGVGLRCNSNSEDNLSCRRAEGSPPIPRIPRSHSSPDFAQLPPAAAPVADMLSNVDREFADLIDYNSTLATAENETPQKSGQTTRSGTPQQVRTKVLIGSIDAGKITVGEPMLFGPTSSGDFLSVVVSSLRLSNVPVRCATAGQTVTFKLAECLVGPGILASTRAFPVQSGQRRSTATGLVLLSPPAVEEGTPEAAAPALSHWEFEAELLVLNHPSKIRVNYEPVVHVGCVKQSAKLVSVRKIVGSQSTDTGRHQSVGEAFSTDEVGNGERAICRFRFLYYPEFIIRGEAMIIREQRTRGVGTITALL